MLALLLCETLCIVCKLLALDFVDKSIYFTWIGVAVSIFQVHAQNMISLGISALFMSPHSSDLHQQQKVARFSWLLGTCLLISMQTIMHCLCLHLLDVLTVHMFEENLAGSNFDFDSSNGQTACIVKSMLH